MDLYGISLNTKKIKYFNKIKKPIFHWQITEKEIQDIKQESLKPYKQRPLLFTEKLELGVLPENSKWRNKK